MLKIVVGFTISTAAETPNATLASDSVLEYLNGRLFRLANCLMIDDGMIGIELLQC
jgi:hypothetical protein